MAANNDNANLKTALHEPMKQYLVYDGSGRLITIYETRANAADGDTCLKTTYTYDGGTSRIEKMKEENDVWDSTWDI